MEFWDFGVEVAIEAPDPAELAAFLRERGHGVFVRTYGVQR